MSAKNKQTPKKTPPNRRKKRKTRIRPGRLLALLLAAVLAAAALGYAGYTGVTYVIQRQKQSALDAVLSQQQEALESAGKIQSTGTVSDTTFESLRSLAVRELNENIAFLNETMAGKISQEDYDKAMALQNDDDSPSYYWLLNNAYQIPEEFLEFAMEDASRLEFVCAYPQKETYETPPDSLSESLKSVPSLVQYDLDWGYVPYGDSVIAFSGSAPASLSMVFSYLKQDASITPAALAVDAYTNGYYVSGSGTSNAFLSEAGNAYGIVSEALDPGSDSISSALMNGKLIIANVSEGDFGDSPHFLVITATDGSNVRVLDPLYPENSSVQWDTATLLQNTGSLWAYSARSAAETENGEDS